jgi:hypothetical protein
VTAQPQKATRTSQKRGYSETSDFQSRGLGQQCTCAHRDDLGPIPVIKSLPAGPHAQNSLGLEVIRESDEDLSQYADGTQPMDDDQDLCWETALVTTASSAHDTALNEDSDGANGSNSSWHSDESDSSDDNSVEILEPHWKLTVHRGKKGGGRKPYSKRAGRAGKGNDNSEKSDINSSDDYDPETCGTYTALALTWEVSH